MCACILALESCLVVCKKPLLARALGLKQASTLSNCIYNPLQTLTYIVRVKFLSSMHECPQARFAYS